MPYKFFENAITNGLSQLPNEAFRERQQAAISAGFDVTTNKYIVQEQTEIGSRDYNEVEAWIGNAMEMTTRGLANGDDFKKLIFEDINHEVKRGLYYKFDDNVWLTNSTDKHTSLDVVVGLRRCNNVLKIIDPENGSVFCIPCVLAYEMTAPNIQVTSAVLTPNNHNKVLVQGNKDTLRLFKLNSRFVLEGRVFKLFAYQDAIIDERIAPIPTLLTLDLFLDEIQAKDDIENQLADNGVYNYTIDIDSEDMELVSESVGHLDASIALNGAEVKRKIVWESLSPGIVEIDESGNYKVVGYEGDSCTIMASLAGNPDVYDTITIDVVNEKAVQPKIIVEPLFDKVRQYETIEFDIKVAYGDDIINPGDTSVGFAGDCLTVQKNGNHYKIAANSIEKENQTLKIRAENVNPGFDVTTDLSVAVTSMLG